MRAAHAAHRRRIPSRRGRQTVVLPRGLAAATGRRIGFQVRAGRLDRRPWWRAIMAFGLLRDRFQAGLRRLRGAAVNGAAARRARGRNGVPRCIRRPQGDGLERGRSDRWHREPAGRAPMRCRTSIEQSGSQPPSILSTFQNWAEPVDVAGLDSVAATGAIPMVTWNCGDTDANVAAGSDDAMVSAEAQALAATDVPVLFRWFPDPNLTGGSAATSCLGTAGASGYVAAYQHIHSLFVAAGATNVAFVWSVDTSSAADPNLGGLLPRWTGRRLDRCRRRRDTERRVAARRVHQRVRIVVLGVLGVRQTHDGVITGADAGSQSAYLDQIRTDLPGHYPQVKALVYFDAPDLASGDQYQLDAAGSASFQQLAGSPVFNPARSTSKTKVSPSQTSVSIGTTVTLSASVDASDNSGSVSFLDNGAVIGGCVFVPITDRTELPNVTADRRGAEHRRRVRWRCNVRAVDFGARHRDRRRAQRSPGRLRGLLPSSPTRTPSGSTTSTSSVSLPRRDRRPVSEPLEGSRAGRRVRLSGVVRRPVGECAPARQSDGRNCEPVE